MQKGFANVHFHVGDKKARRSVSSGRTSRLRGGKQPDAVEAVFADDETAARFYLRKKIGEHAHTGIRSLADAEDAQLQNMRLVSIQNLPLTKTRMIRFEQTVKSIPVFGSLAVVELDRNRKLVSVDAELAELRGQSASAKIGRAEALRRVAEKAGVNQSRLGDIPAPTLTFYHDDNHNSWHLAYLFRNVPAAPPEYMRSRLGKRASIRGRLSLLPTDKRPLINYIVDANNGNILLFYSATPTLTTSLVVPTKCYGIDADNKKQEFWGRKSGRDFEMSDPLNSIKTYDLNYADMDSTKFPPKTVVNSTNDWQSKNKAAVSAHLNATRVMDFYNSVLKRKGVDDKGMELVSIVNCTVQGTSEKSPEWHNACWYDGRMWYGQEKIGKDLISLARNLDIIAHELTHGVTEFSSNLVYLNQSGALNESFSDIMAIIIKNWYAKGLTSSVAGWDWEIGKGMNGAGLPLRDFKNPKRIPRDKHHMQPDHMKDYLYTTVEDDEGGVHTNSNIHNKAAYNVLTAKDSKGKYVFAPADTAILFYYCLIRLNATATFSKTLEVLLEVAKTIYMGDASSKSKLNAIKTAYRKVGIK